LSVPANFPAIIAGRYRVVGELGRGGMGRVLKVVHVHTGEPLAMKLLIVPEAGRDRALERFNREARTLAQVRGDHVVRVMDAGLAPEIGDAPYIVMELLEGEDLGQYVTRRGRLRPGESVALLHQIALGLSRVHRAGLVHRDLKPANIFLERMNDRWTVKLLDFGLVRGVSRDHAADAVTGQGEILGTPLYMSPEQVHGNPDAVGAATDIWATGILAYYLLTGQPYWNLRDLPRGMFDIGSAPLSPPSVLEPSLSVAFDAWFLRSCARNPAARWPDPMQQWQELARALGVPADALSSIASQAPEIPSSTEETRVASVPATTSPVTPPPSTSATSTARQRRQVTVLFYRFAHRGGAGEEMDPEDFEASEARLHARLDQAIGDLRQTSTELARGGRFVFFGYPVAFGFDARRAVDAALRLTALVHEVDRELRAGRQGGLDVRVGIHTGVVLAGPSAEMPGASEVVGQALGVATDLEHQAQPGQILVSDATWRLLGSRFEGSRLDRDRVVITGVAPDASGSTSRPAMIGREAELAILSGCLDAAREGDTQTVLITGEVGIGKSRLVEAVRDLAVGGGADWLACQCSPFFQRTPFYPVLDLVRQLIPHTSGDVAESLGFLLSLPGADQGALAALSPQLRRERAMHAVIAAIHQRSAASPVVLAVEDLHWADPSTLEWLDRLSVLKGPRLLTLLTARPEFSPSWSSPGAVVPVQLRRLGQAQTTKLITAVAGAALPEAVAALVAKTTDGIPLFIEELTRLVAERPDAAESGSFSAGSVPTSLGEAMTARLDRLGQARAIAEMASVIGPTFEVDDVRALAGGDASVPAKIQELVRAKVLQPVGLPPHSVYQFQHALVRDAAYGSLPRDARRALHLQAAQVLAARNMPPEVIAQHFDEGGRALEAAGLLLQAGQGALARSANAEARAHFKRGSEILERHEKQPVKGQPPVDPTLDITLRTMHGMAWVVSRGYAVPEAEPAFAGAMKKVLALGDRDVPGVVPALFANWVYMFVRGRVADAAAQGERLRRSAERSGDSGAIMMARLAEGTVALDQGRFSDALERFDDALRRYDPQAHFPYRFMYGQDPKMYGLVFKAWTLWCVGAPDQARDVVAEAVAHTRALAHPHSLGFALSIAAIIQHYRGDLDALDTTVAELTELSAQQGWLQWLAFAKLYAGAAAVLHGRLDEGVAEMRAGREISMAMGEVPGASHYEAVFADGLIRAGQLDEAAARLERVLADVIAAGQRAFEADIARLQGDIAERRGDLTAAAAKYREALDLARARGAKSYELRASAALERLAGRR
jgi:serine/threonine protein kinase/predicted ATPase